MNTPDASVVICAYAEDRWDDLLAAVDSVRRQSAPPREIIVVIDHHPGLLARARAHLRDVAVLESTEPRGLSGARNTGVGAARGGVVAFLDDDATAAPDWLAWLLEGFRDPRVLGVGGAPEPRWQGGRPSWLPEEFYWVVGCSYRGLRRTPGPVRNLIGASMAFRREVFVAVGGFRHDVGQVGASMLRCDDTEFCIRATQRWPQGILWYEPRARAFHRVPAHRARWAYFRSRCYTEGLAKAQVARLVGAGDGLAAEWRYALRTLPGGVADGVAGALLHGEPAGLARAGAIVAGLALAIAGYVVGTASARVVDALRGGGAGSGDRAGAVGRVAHGALGGTGGQR